MSRFTFFADIAGQVSLDTKGSNRITAAAVAIPSIETDALRARVLGTPKWRDCTEEVAAQTVGLIADSASAIAVSSITKNSESWERFWESHKPLHDAIVHQDRAPAGFIKPSNLIRFAILGESFAMALGHAVRIAHRPGIVDYRSRDLIERTIVCDSDVQGDENVSVFKQLWARSDEDQPQIGKAGFRFITREVIVTTEQNEPLLLLADFVAGIAHSALIESPGRLSLPVSHEPSKRLLRTLNDSGKLVVSSKSFALEYEEVFGDALAEAARQNAR
jgi:hypothetical protein